MKIEKNFQQEADVFFLRLEFLRNLDRDKASQIQFLDVERWIGSAENLGDVRRGVRLEVIEDSGADATQLLGRLLDELPVIIKQASVLGSFQFLQLLDPIGQFGHVGDEVVAIVDGHRPIKGLQQRHRILDSNLGGVLEKRLTPFLAGGGGHIDQ